MTRPLTALATVGLSVVLAACGSGPGGANTKAGSPPATTSASASTLELARTRLLPVVTSAPAASVGARWTLLGMADGGRRVLLQTVASGGCAVFAGVLVKEGASLVTISPRTLVSRRTGGLCPDHQVLTIGSVELAAPLGRRVLSQGDPTYPR